jgi:hypothetical protein
VFPRHRRYAESAIEQALLVDDENRAFRPANDDEHRGDSEQRTTNKPESTGEQWQRHGGEGAQSNDGKSRAGSRGEARAFNHAGLTLTA